MASSPIQVLDTVAQLPPGEGLRLDFETQDETRGYAAKLRAQMSVAARQSRADFAPTDPEWGHHPWEQLSIQMDLPRCKLWVFNPKEPKITRVKGAAGAP